MQPWQIILGIFLFAVVGAVLYVWGLKKSLNQREKLSQILYNKSANKVLSEFKKKESLSNQEIIEIIEGIKASEFYSRQKAVITDAKTYSKQLTEKMTEQNLIEKITVNGKTKYKEIIKSKEK